MTKKSNGSAQHDTERHREDYDQFLQAILPNIAFDGWTDKAMRQTTLGLGLPTGTENRLFPDGPKQLLTFFIDWVNRQMVTAAEGIDLDDMRVRDRVTWLVRKRLEILHPHKEALRAALAFLAQPQHAALASRLLYRSCDRIWRLAGDRSTDFNFYTKRGLLAGVLSSTTLYWLNDRSEDHTESWAFLDRRIENVMTLGKNIGRVKNVSGGLETIVGGVKNPLSLLKKMRRRQKA